MLDTAERSTSAMARREPARIDLLMRLGGADADVAPFCSSYERNLLRLKGTILVAGFIPSFLVWSVGLTRLTGMSMFGIIAAAVLALSIVAAVFAFDRCVLASAWLSSGRAILVARGAIAPMDRGAGALLGRILALLPRLLLPVCSAAVGTALALTVALESDIAVWQHQEDLRRNAPVYAQARDTVEAQLAIARATHASATEARQRLNEERDRLLISAATPSLTSIERERAAVLARRDALQAERSQGEREALQREGDAAAERAGVRLRDGHTGRAGDGPMARFHAERAAQLSAAARRVAAEINETEGRIVQLQAREMQERQRAEAGMAERLSALETRLAAAIQREAEATQDLNTLLAEQGRRIRELAHARPDYIAPADGLAGRLQGLHGFAMNSAASAALVLGAELLLILIELLGAIAALRLPPTGFAIRLAVALEEEMRAASVAAFDHDLAARLRNTLREPA